MKDALLYAAIGVILFIAFGHKLLISDLEQRVKHVESVTFGGSRCQK